MIGPSMCSSYRFLLVAIFALSPALSRAQVPKPPWASGQPGASKTQPSASRKSADASAPDAPAPDPEATIKVDVKLVNVFVTVTDQHGAPIGGLNKDNFRLKEDGLEQKIAVFDRESPLPLSIVLAIDTSLSTRRDLPLELVSARRFTHAILRPVDALSLYGFSETVSEVVPFTSDLHLIDRGIDRLRLGSATALYDAMYLSSHALERRRGQKSYGRDHRWRRYRQHRRLSGGGARRARG